MNTDKPASCPTCQRGVDTNGDGDCMWCASPAGKALLARGARTTIDQDPPRELLEATRAPKAGGCPDGGACHHGCDAGACFRVKTSEPLSGVYPSDVWPASERAKMLAWWSDKGTAPRRTEDALTRLLHAHRASIDAANRAGDTAAYLEQLSERGGWPKDLRETEARLREREAVADARHAEFEAMRRAFLESVTVGSAPLPAREAMEAALVKLRDFAEEDLYGHFYGGDPRDFRPDPECTSPEEREAHRAACEALNRGEPAEVQPAARVPLPGGASGVRTGSFGLGTTHVRDRAILAICERLEAALGADRSAKPLAEALEDAENARTAAELERDAARRETAEANRRIASLEGRLGVAEEACGQSLPELLNVSQEMVGRIALAFSERGSIRAANLAEAVDELIVSERGVTHRMVRARDRWRRAAAMIQAALTVLKRRPPTVEWRDNLEGGFIATLPFAFLKVDVQAGHTDEVCCAVDAGPDQNGAFKRLHAFTVDGTDALARGLELTALLYRTHWRTASGWYEDLRKALETAADGPVVALDEDTENALDRLRRIAWRTTSDEPVEVGCIDLCLICETLAAAAGYPDGGEPAAPTPGDGT